MLQVFSLVVCCVDYSDGLSFRRPPRYRVLKSESYMVVSQDEIFRRLEFSECLVSFCIFFSGICCLSLFLACALRGEIEWGEKRNK